MGGPGRSAAKPHTQQLIEIAKSRICRFGVAEEERSDAPGPGPSSIPGRRCAPPRPPDGPLVCQVGWKSEDMRSNLRDCKAEDLPDGGGRVGALRRPGTWTVVNTRASLRSSPATRWPIGLPGGMEIRRHVQKSKRLQSRGSSESGWPGRSAATPRDLGRRQYRGVAALLPGHPHGPLACRAGWKSEVSLKLLRMRRSAAKPRPPKS